jgi:hypothetical protein
MGIYEINRDDSMLSQKRDEAAGEAVIPKDVAKSCGERRRLFENHRTCSHSFASSF